MKHRYIASSDVARILHVSPKTVSRWARDGQLPFIRTLGGHRRFPKVEIEQIAMSLGGHSVRHELVHQRGGN